MADTINDTGTNRWIVVPASSLLIFSQLSAYLSLRIVDMRFWSHGEVLANVSQAPSNQQKQFFCA